MCELDMNRERGRRAPRAHREQARYAPRAHQAYMVQMKAKSYFWNLIYIYLIFHYVSSRNYENGSYCSLKWEGR